jgi:hypothetical protein
MDPNKVHILSVQPRAAPRATGRFARLPTDLLFLLALAIAFVAAHYSDKPPLVEKPISLQRAEAPLVAQPNGIGVRVMDTGLRGFER